MGYFKNTTVGGALWPPSTFVVSSSIMIKFGVLIEFDKFSPKSPKKVKMTSLPSYDVVLCFRLPCSLKFRNSLFLDQFG